MYPGHAEEVRRNEMRAAAERAEFYRRKAEEEDRAQRARVFENQRRGEREFAARQRETSERIWKDSYGYGYGNGSWLKIVVVVVLLAYFGYAILDFTFQYIIPALLLLYAYKVSPSLHLIAGKIRKVLSR